MKAEHISIALKLEDIPHIGRRAAALLREAGIHKPEELKGQDALWLYNKICSITASNHNLQLLDRLLAATDFADGGAPRPLRVFSKQRESMQVQLTGVSLQPGNEPRDKNQKKT